MDYIFVFNLYFNTFQSYHYNNTWVKKLRARGLRTPNATLKEKNYREGPNTERGEIDIQQDQEDVKAHNKDVEKVHT